MSRREFSKAVKRAAFERAGGKCEDCGMPLMLVVEYDHATPDYMGGEPTLENCVCLCRICHKSKTARDRPVNDRTRRITDRNIGIRKRSTFAGSRDSPWKKKIDGRVVPR